METNAFRDPIDDDRFRHGVDTTSAPNASRVSQILWQQLDRYRGLVSVAEQSDLVLALLYLRGVNPESWRSLAEQAYVGSRGFESATFRAFSADNNIHDLAGLVSSIAQAAELRHLVPVVQTIDSAGSSDENFRYSIAPVFSDLLARFAALEGRTGGGEFHTPRSVAKLASRLLKPSPRDQMFDPCCGTGEFLATAVDDLRERDDDTVSLSVSGSSLTPRARRLAYMNLRLRDVFANISQDAGISLQGGRPEGRYTLVLTNPPFNMSHWASYDALTRGQWRYGEPPAHNANFAWLQYVVSSLDDGGRAAVLMTSSAGTSENPQERHIRTAMLTDGAVSAVIALPPQLFTSTPIPATMWILQSPGKPQGSGVLFIDATALGTVHGRAQRTLTGSDIDKVVRAYTDWQTGSVSEMTGFAASASLERIAESGHRLNPREYVASPTVTMSRSEAARAVTLLHRRLDELHGLADEIDAVADRHMRRIELWTL